MDGVVVSALGVADPANPQVVSEPADGSEHAINGFPGVVWPGSGALNTFGVRACTSMRDGSSGERQIVVEPNAGSRDDGRNEVAIVTYDPATLLPKRVEHRRPIREKDWDVTTTEFLAFENSAKGGPLPSRWTMTRDVGGGEKYRCECVARFVAGMKVPAAWWAGARP